MQNGKECNLAVENSSPGTIDRGRGCFVEFCSGDGVEFSPDRYRRDVHAPAPDCREQQHFCTRPTTANILNSVMCICFCIHPGAEESAQFRSVLVAHSCPTLCDPLDCSLPGSSGHGILQARILEWGTMPSSRRSSRPSGLPHCRQILYHLSHWGNPFHTRSSGLKGQV